MSTSIVNMQSVFNLRRFVALLSAPRTPYDAAVRELDLGHPERALRALDELLEPQTPSARRAEIQNKRGVAFVRLERRAEAAQAFESALACDASFSPALVNLGNLAFERDDVAAAIELYRRAVECDPQNGSAHRHLALAYRRTGRVRESFEAFAKARRLEVRRPNNQSRPKWPSHNRE